MTLTNFDHPNLTILWKRSSSCNSAMASVTAKSSFDHQRPSRWITMLSSFTPGRFASRTPFLSCSHSCTRSIFFGQTTATQLVAALHPYVASAFATDKNVDNLVR